MKKIYLILFFTGSLMAFDYQGDITLKHTQFFEKDDNSKNEDRQGVIEGHFKLTTEEETFSYQLEALGRVDVEDPDRNIATPLDSYIKYQMPTSSFSAGYHIFNWSVMEFFHPVDTINPRNFDIAGEKIERLGQASLVYSKEFESSLLQLIYMPFHTDPKLPSKKNRALYQLDFASPVYVTGNKQGQRWPDVPQFGIRYKSLIDPVEFDIQLFRKYATHIPFFLAPGPAIGILSGINSFEIVPHYFPMTQLSVALTMPIDETMYKAEIAYYDFDNYKVNQIEYKASQFPPLVDSVFKPQDYGLIANGLEYTHNYVNQQEGTFFIEHQFIFDVNSKISQRYSFFQNDLAIGYRHNFNDFRSWDLISSYIIDSKEPTQSVFNLQTSCRFMEQYRFTATLRVVNSKAVSNNIINLEKQTGLRPLRLSDNAQLKVTRYF